MGIKQSSKIESVNVKKKKSIECIKHQLKYKPIEVEY